MASNNGSVGKWEVVKKGKKNSSSLGSKNAADKKSGGGGRKALSESNLQTRRKCQWPSRVQRVIATPLSLGPSYPEPIIWSALQTEPSDFMKVYIQVSE